MTENRDYSYLSFFNLQAPPFSLVPDPSLFFPARAHLESLEVLTFALSQGSLISVLTGDPGLGKTQVVLTLLSRLSDSVRPIMILNPALNPREFFETLFKELAISETTTDTQNKDYIIKRLKEFFTKSSTDFFRRYLIIIDEAQLLPFDTLEELRLLTNLNEGKDLFLQIFLIGQPTLSTKLKNPQLSPLLQRISVWENLRPLEREEVFPYIWFRIKQVSDSPNIIFDRGLEKPIHKITKGIPRLINKLMDRVLFVAYVNGEKIIKKSHLKEAKKTFAERLLD